MKTIVTEGPLDAAMLGAVIGRANIQHCSIKVAGGKTSVVPLAKSVLLSQKIPVALLMDADTTDPASVRSQELINYDLLRPAAGRVPFRVFFAIPEIEAVYFSDPVALANTLGVRITKLDREKASASPRATLEALLRRARKRTGRTWLVDHLSDRLVHGVMQHPLIRSLTDFLRDPAPWTPS